MFVFFSWYQLDSAPPLTQKQQLNQIKKIMPVSKKAPITKKTTPLKPLPPKNQPTKIIPPKKVTVITNLNDLTKAIEKFHADQKKLRATNRNQACNQYLNIQDSCACTGASCSCPTIPPFFII